MANVDQFCGQIGAPWCHGAPFLHDDDLCSSISKVRNDGHSRCINRGWARAGRGPLRGKEQAEMELFATILLSTGWLINTGPPLESPHWFIMLNNSKMEKMPNQKKAKVLLISLRWARERERDREGEKWQRFMKAEIATTVVTHWAGNGRWWRVWYAKATIEARL